MTETENIIPTDDRADYELDYLLSPFVPAETVEKTMAEIFTRIFGAFGATVITEQAPKMRTLSYPIIKAVNNKNTSFRDAYFGWLKFKATGEAAVKIKEALDKEDGLVRFLIIHALKPSPKAGFRRFASDRRAPVLDGQPVNATVVAGEKGPEMSAEEIDREIDTLLVGAEAEAEKAE